MNKNDLITIANAAGSFINKQFPLLLTIAGTIGFGKTIQETIKHHDECEYELQAAKNEKEELTVSDKAKIYVKSYKTAIGYGFVSLTCFYTAQGINSKRIATLATAYSMKEVALSNYITAAEKIVGKNKSEKIKYESESQQLEKAVKNDVPIVNATYGSDLFYIPALGIMFRGDMEHVKQAFDDADSYMSSNDEVSVNYLLYKLGLLGIGVGDMLGWKLDKIFKQNGYNPAKCKIPRDFNSCLLDGKPYAIIEINPEPLSIGYDKYGNQFLY